MTLTARKKITGKEISSSRSKRKRNEKEKGKTRGEWKEDEEKNKNIKKDFLKGEVCTKQFKA